MVASHQGPLDQAHKPKVSEPGGSSRTERDNIARRVSRAVHLGGPAAEGFTDRTKITLSPSDFQGKTEAQGTPQETRCFYEKLSLFRTGRFQGHEPYKGKETLPGSSVDVSEFGCVKHFWARRTYSSGSGLGGNLTPFPFWAAARQTRACVCVWADVSLRKRISPIPWNGLTPVQRCSNGTLSSFSPQGFHLSIVLPQDLHRGGSGGLSRHLKRTPTATLPSLRRKNPHEKSAVRRYSPTLRGHHFRLVASVPGSFYNPFSKFRLPWHRDFLEQPTFMGSHERLASDA
ncbi:hypothetical protein JTE90_022913 [Oedothorax gibbosus]|uniref:Uncharacterized protein n=1 Tax=Oedothorax gibbosus TaxID=931172 RepID=A0AAV6TLZ4_9ARAC|nr:hypothetical protein JTE90_022913 [Oedothorax gibbosus]